ncbi:DUF1641 domain-containing protein [Virgibacillus kekensis]|uniref:DUF1641 domain-containing protein n=1 Tax=Virgibacillus kekensis TaxID=202261 RepID=A0ABV9DGC1_9BACI
MADQISNIKRMKIPEETVREHNLDEVTKAVSENKEAILKGIDFLSMLNDSGYLDMTNALIKHKDEAMANVFKQLNRPQYSAAVENLVKMFILVGELNVDELQNFSEKLNRGLEKADESSEQESTSYMDLLKALKDPEINRSITMLLNFLRGMGRE